MLLVLWLQTGGELRLSGNTAALRKAAGVSCNSRCTPGTASAPDSLQQPCAPARVHKTKPRGRSRCTSTREAPRNKSRGRADRTLVLGCCGAAAQNAGSRPGLPLIAPDTRRFQPTPRGRKPRPPRSGKKKLRQTTPGTKEHKNLAQGFGRPAMGA